MNMIRNLKFAVAFAVVAISGTAQAIPVTVLDYSGSANPGVAMEITAGGVFQTAGAAALASFLNWSSILPAIDGVGKIKISGVQLTGAANVLAGVYSQATTGGIVEALDNANVVLLSATFTNGVISIASNGVGSQFTTGLAAFGGLYASYFLPNTATHTVSLINWNPVAINDAQKIAASAGLGNGLLGGQVDPDRGNDLPEPATMLLLGSGIIGAALKKRRIA